ncbi:response regulator [Desulfococcaceae bacterium HSG8]|nr:response regulator [Desulfococcaceae bacterium HSG8]
MKGRILIMDDEEIIRDIASQMLRRLGYDVELSEDGAEAAAAYKKAMNEGKRFDIVILDLQVRKGMGGKDAMKELIKIDPDVKGIISSGYSNDPEMTDFEKYGFSGVVEKPYSIQELSRNLEKVMASFIEDKK